MSTNDRDESGELITPYASGDLRTQFDSWLERAVSRHSQALEFREIRQGVRALSSLWLERRGAGELARRSIEGRGKRAALATYFSALHFLAVHHAIDQLGRDTLANVRRIFDLGCGTGACGAAAALSLELPGKVFGVDRSAWVLGEARRTWSHFGIRHHTRRADLPNGTPEGARGDAFILGWVVNELQPRDRDELLKRLSASIDRGARMLIVEPLARAVSPWWDSWCETLDARSEIIRLRIERPTWVEDLDRASGLDHSTLGARVLYVRA